MASMSNDGYKYAETQEAWKGLGSRKPQSQKMERNTAGTVLDGYKYAETQEAWKGMGERKPQLYENVWFPVSDPERPSEIIPAYGNIKGFTKDGRIEVDVHSAITRANQRIPYKGTATLSPDDYEFKKSDLMKRMKQAGQQHEAVQPVAVDGYDPGKSQAFRKYRLTDESIMVDDVKAYRIQAIKNFGDVRIGDLGGFVQSETNLGHAGTCWIYDNAVVTGSSTVRDSAILRDHVELLDNSHVSGYAQISGRVLLDGNSQVYGNAKITSDTALVGTDLNVHGDALIDASGQITKGYLCDNSKITGHVEIKPDDIHRDSVVMSENSRIEGKVQVKATLFARDDATITGGENGVTLASSRSITLQNDALIQNESDYLSLGDKWENGGDAFRCADGSVRIRLSDVSRDALRTDEMRDYVNASDIWKGGRNYILDVVQYADDHIQEAGMAQDFADAVASISDPGGMSV